MSYKSDISFIILAGGESSRLGRNKLSERIGGESLLQHVINRLAAFGAEIIIVKGKTKPSFYHPGKVILKEICDVYPGRGPLGGIYSGLKVSTSYRNFVVAGDMPFVNPLLISKMIEEAGNYDVFLPRIGGLFEPLHAIYAKSCLETIEILMISHQLSVLNLLPLVKTGYIEKEMVEKYDPTLRCLFNVNSERDLKQARNLLRGIETAKAMTCSP